MTTYSSRIALATCALGLLSAPLMAQDAAPAPKETPPPAAAQPAPPAAGQDILPPVDVVQPKETATKAPAKKKTVAKKSVRKPRRQPSRHLSPLMSRSMRRRSKPRPRFARACTMASGTVNMSPVSGSDLPIEKVPTSVGRASSEDFARTRETGLPQALQSTVPGVFMNDTQGNVFQGGEQYRGFRILADQRCAAGHRRLPKRHAYQ